MRDIGPDFAVANGVIWFGVSERGEMRFRELSSDREHGVFQLERIADVFLQELVEGLSRCPLRAHCEEDGIGVGVTPLLSWFEMGFLLESEREDLVLFPNSVGF